MIGRDTVDQIIRLIEPIRNRIANVIARAVISSVDDSRTVQSVQLRILDGETVDDAERLQGYGFSSVPHPGSESVVAFVGGDRSHPVIVSVDDRRYRPTGGKPGDVTIYSSSGSSVSIHASGEIVVTGDDIRIGSSSASDPVIRQSDLVSIRTWIAGHTHSGGGSGPPSSPPPTITGSGKVKAE